jgi:hypothetical protein
MNRRRLLAGASALAGALLAGCLGGGGPSGSNTPTGTETTPTTAAPSTDTATTTTSTATETPTTDATATSPSSTEPSGSTGGTETGPTGTAARSPTGTDSAAPDTTTVVERRLAVEERSCGAAVDEGTIAFENGEIGVTGTITGSDGCATAALETAAYDRAANRLRIVVVTEDDSEPGTVCAQCLTEIDYEATVSFGNGVPETVVLVHRGTTGETRVETATA